jgi:hypothetical protein
MLTFREPLEKGGQALRLLDVKSVFLSRINLSLIINVGENE